MRETFEETGLLLGLPAAATRRAPADEATTSVWNAFARAGLAPAFGTLRLVARAITPTYSPARFHTRFFLADGENARGSLGGDGELENVRWVPVATASSLPMPRVTTLVLDEALAHRALTAKSTRPAALFRWIGTEMRPRHNRGMERLRA
jgi:8-oxo-dGTP pyrophosphatase MutT (NUDIX family)